MISDIADINDDMDLWGGKAVLLSKLKKTGIWVPHGFVVSSNYYMQYVNGNLNEKDVSILLEEYCQEYFNEFDEIIFRSSANIEGSYDSPCCGVFDSFVEDRGISKLENIKRIWSSTETSVAKKYMAHEKIPAVSLKMATLVQKVVQKIYCRYSVV